MMAIARHHGRIREESISRLRVLPHGEQAVAREIWPQAEAAAVPCSEQFPETQSRDAAYFPPRAAHAVEGPETFPEAVTTERQRDERRSGTRLAFVTFR